MKHLMYVRFCRAVILLALFLLPATAAIRPSFDLEYFSWHATNIFLAEVTPVPGKFRVIESWKGRLKPGQVVEIPRLQPGPAAVPISEYPRMKEFFAPDPAGIGEQVPARPIHSRIVFFLKVVHASPQPDLSQLRTRGGWESSDFFGEMKTSALWVEEGRVYAFQQVTNLGPSILMPWQDITLSQTKSKVAEILRVQEQITKVINTQDEIVRAEGLKFYVLSTDFEIRQIAFGELIRCGSAGAQAIREMLDTPAFAGRFPELTEALADISQHSNSSR